jgi:uncharacterized protein YneF (UPF0154 family)
MVFNRIIIMYVPIAMAVGVLLGFAISKTAETFKK